MSRSNHSKQPDTEKARFAAELGVDAVYLIDEPPWYLRATGRFHQSWRREVAFELGLLGVGLAAGLIVGGRWQPPGPRGRMRSLRGDECASNAGHAPPWVPLGG